MKRHIGLLLTVLLLLAFAMPTGAQEDVYFPMTEWRTSTPEEQGIDSTRLERFLTQASLPGDGFHSIVLIRHGTVVLDTSMHPFQSSEPQAFRDTTEAVLATLIGIAIDQGYIQGVDQSIWDFLDKTTIANMDADKEALTIEDFLTHRSGLNYPEDTDYQHYYPLGEGDESWIQVFLDAEMFPPSRARWCHGDGLVLSAILQQATGMTAVDFAQETLFSPLGIRNVTWLSNPQGITIGSDELYISPLDMAKIAYLYLHNGQWAGQQIVSERWTQAATSRIAEWLPDLGFDNYGYGWVVAGEGRNHFFGQLNPGGEQFGVFPELDLIYMVTGDLNFQVLRYLRGDVLTSISESATLPENPDAFAILNAKVESLANPTPVDIAALPEALQAVSGRTYTLQENEAGWQTLSVDFGAGGSNEATVVLGIDGNTVRLTAGMDMVYRVTPVGLPAQPDSGTYRLYGNVPWMATATASADATANRVYIYMGDLMGRETWTVGLRFPTEDQVSVHATMRGLSPSRDWYFDGTAG